MSVYLEEMLSGWDQQERNKVNENWRRIMATFTNLQRQINILAGGEEVDELLQRINEAITKANEAAENANSTMESAVEDFNNAMQQLQEVVSDAITATSNATSAAQSANDKVVEATQLLSTLKTLQEELQQLQTTLTQVIGSAQIATQDAIDATTAADTAAVNATTAANNANDATTAANNAAATIAGWGTAIEWTNGTYNKNNVVTRNGNTYQARKDGVTSAPPNPAVTNEDWIVLAVRGVDGTGAVSTVNGKSPDANGNVDVEVDTEWSAIQNIPISFPPSEHTHEISDINGLQDTLEGKADSTELTTLEQEVTEHLEQSATETTKGHVELATSAETTAGIDNTRAVHPAGLKAALDKKVNKTQGNWVTGTLLNGWQGSIRFSANDLSVVTVDMSAYGGTVAKDTIICTLPVGFRPSRALVISALTDTNIIVNGSFYIDTGGNIKIGVALNAGVYHSTLVTFVSI